MEAKKGAKILDFVDNKDKKDALSIADKVNDRYDKSNEYRGSFTVHGLSRALTGNFYENIFWGFIVLSSLTAIAVLAWKLAVKYRNNEVYIKFFSKEYSKLNMPIFTICPNKIDKRRICNLTNDCINNSTDISTLYTENSSYAWWNDKMSVIVINESRKSVKTGIQLRDYIKSTYYQCIRMNLSFFDTSSSSSNGIHVYTVYPKSNIEVYVHDEKEQYPFFQTKPNYIEALESDEINIEVIQYKRLKYPFSSNCSQILKDMIFPGGYTKLKCVESLKCMNSLKACGGTYDFCEQFLNNNFRVKYAKNFSALDLDILTKCLKSEYEKSYDNECALACEESIFKIIMSYTTKCSWLQNNAREIYVNYPLGPYYHVFEEAQLYSFEQFLSECGGLVSLFTGSSAISLIEITTFLCLVLIKYIYNKNNKKTP
ncbi:uncharacterized protein LOC105849803 [Hydra vulgaris]|uniref:Uncharacterized protein LOC105849803 n=1 Tax=Hydra vulgaris TaxID=6087 RepID=A0ABM4BH47_HYDVU